MEAKTTAFQDILIDNKDKIYRICCYYLSDPEDRKDLYQDILINIWKSLPSFKGKSKLETWIFRIAVNSALGFIYKEKKRKDKNDISKDIVDIQIESNQSKMDEEDKYKQVLDAINCLKTSDKVLISMYLENLSQKEIAEISGFSESNVRVKIHRIKKILTKIVHTKEKKNGKI